MPRYSAVEAISPAVERTKEFLFKPFHWGRFLKLALVAVLTEGGTSSCNFMNKVPGGAGSGSGQGPSAHNWHWPDWFTHGPSLAHVVTVAAVALLIVIPVLILIHYLLIRLRFSYFECILLQQDTIAPAWRRYHRAAMRYLGLSLMLGFAFWMVLGAAAIAIYRQYQPLFASLAPGGSPNFADFLPLVIFGVLGLLALVVVGAVLQIGMNYFVFPHMALQDASIGESVSRAWDAITVEPGQFALFLVFVILLPAVGGIAGGILLAIPSLILGAILVAVGAALYAAMGNFAFVITGPIGLSLLLLFILGVLALGGTIGTFTRTYAMLFYGGRYAELGEVLWPPATQATGALGSSGSPSGDVGLVGPSDAQGKWLEPG